MTSKNCAQLGNLDSFYAINKLLRENGIEPKGMSDTAKLAAVKKLFEVSK